MPYMEGVPRRRGRPAAAPRPPPRAPDSDAPGVAASLRAVLDGGATDADRDRAGRLFRNLLWPVRGGRLGRPFRDESHRAIEIATVGSTAVRAAADGVVVAAGETIPGLGRSIVLLHRNGWITVYGQVAELHVEEGTTVRRGAWIARAGETLHFELRDGGALADPVPHLVQVPPPPP
jgi:murein DD-endopeptidase MepM/ murein hydrolase activator NlpD